MAMPGAGEVQGITRLRQFLSLKALSGLALAIGVFHALWFIGVTFRTRFDVPAWDLWEFMIWWAERESVWRAIYQQYEHHRMVVVGSMVYMDQMLFGGSYLSVYLVTTGATVGLSAWALRHIARGMVDRTLFAFTAAAFLTGVFSLVSSEGYLHGFRAWIPLTLVLAALVVAAFAAARVAETSEARRRYLVLAILLAIADNYTGAPGLLIWPVLVVMAVVNRAGWRTLVVVLVVGGLTVAAFLHGFAHFQQGGGGFANALYPFRLFLSLIQFIGSPVSHSFFIDPFSRISLEFGMLAGFVGLVAFAWIGVRALLKPPGDAVEIAVLGYLVFAFGWTVAASIKHQPAPPAPWQPIFKSSDFMVAMTMWSALFVAVALWLAKRDAPRLRALFGLVALGFTVLFVPLQLQLWPNSERQQQEVRLGGIGYASEVMENGYNTHGFLHSRWRPHNAVVITSFQRQGQVRALFRRLAIPPLDHPAARSVGLNFIDAFGPPVENACDGDVRGRHGVIEGQRLWGKLKLAALGDDVRLVFVDRRLRIVGVGERFDQFKMRMPLDIPGYPDTDGWIGYARAGKAAFLAAVAVDAAGRQICRIPQY